MKNIKKILNKKYPLLFTKIKNHIDNTEKEFCKKDSQTWGGLLWDHTYNVASIAIQLSKKENIDPIIPVIAALFHDSGKFVDGNYHQNEVREEYYAVQVAQKILKEYDNLSEKEKDEIYSAIDSLYNENDSNKNLTSKIIHDADFLSKLGFLGISTLFTKLGTRGINLQGFIEKSLSKELSYQFAAPYTMQTISGRKIAEEKIKGSLEFFNNLLNELKESNIASYKIEEIKLKDYSKLFDKTPKDEAKIYLVIPQECELCGRELNYRLETYKGVKCQKLNSQIICNECDNIIEISFCIPELFND